MYNNSDYPTNIKIHPLQSWSFNYLLNLIKQENKILPGGVWIDAGCGSGCFSSKEINKNHIHLIGIDVSNELLNIAKNNDCYSQIICSDLSDLKEINNNSVEVYFSSNVFHFLNAKGSKKLKKAVSHSFRTLKQGGLLAINCSAYGTSTEFIQVYKKVMQEYLEKLGKYDILTNPFGIKHKLIKDYPIGSMQLFELVDFIKYAGFKIICAKTNYEPTTYTDKIEFIKFMKIYSEKVYFLPFEHLTNSDEIFNKIIEEFIQNNTSPYINKHYMNYIIAKKIN